MPTECSNGSADVMQEGVGRECLTMRMTCSAGNPRVLEAPNAEMCGLYYLLGVRRLDLWDP